MPDLKETEPQDSKKEGLITGEVRQKQEKGRKKTNKEGKGRGLRNEENPQQGLLVAFEAGPP